MCVRMCPSMCSIGVMLPYCHIAKLVMHRRWTGSWGFPGVPGCALVLPAGSFALRLKVDARAVSMV